jgi:3'(2'), 5'-bisphosphate nucleotidase
MSGLAEKIINIAHQAGDAIMEIYQRDFDIVDKSDKSPLTEADLAAHNIIVSGLEEISDLPVLSEESAKIGWETRQQWGRYWLVDPLDGTKEFIKKNGEFTVNIALIENGKATLGVVYAPVLLTTYVGVNQENKLAYKLIDNEKSSISPATHQAGETWKIVGSRSHQSPAIEAMIASFDDEAELVPMGSSLKLCLVAEGKAHLYPRLGPTSEWDTAAAQAVVEAAGGQVTIYEENQALFSDDAKPLLYNQKDSLLNPYFLVSC